MNCTARGLTVPLGFEPLLCPSTLPAPWILANASAIWLRFEFSMQTNNKRGRLTRTLLRTRCSSPVR